MERLALRLDAIVSTVAAFNLFVLAFTRWEEGRLASAVFACSTALLFARAAWYIFRLSRHSPVAALLALVALVVFMASPLFEPGFAPAVLLTTGPGLLYMALPILFYAWIVRDLFKARAEGRLT